MKLQNAEDALAKERQVQEECGVDLPAESDGLTADGPLQSFYKARHQCSQDVHAAEHHLLQCKEEVAKAQGVCKAKWTKKRMYWTKGLPCSAAEIRSLHIAGLPIVAAMLLKSSAGPGEMAADPGLEPRPYEAVVRDQQHASWDDKILQVAPVIVLTGPDGGCFVQRDIYQVADAAGVCEGVHEMTEALQRLEAASVAYTAWKYNSKLMELPDVPVSLSIYKSLMASVPPEQQSVAIVMHCLLEEVMCAVESTDADVLQDAWEVQQATLFVRGTLQARATPSLLKEIPDLDVARFSTVVDGDEPRMRSHGLLSGLIRCNGIRTIFCILVAADNDIGRMVDMCVALRLLMVY